MNRLTLLGLLLLGISIHAQDSSTRIDPFVEKPRVIVLTDMANEPDDQMSMVRYLLYANQLDTEALIATTSTWLRDTTHAPVIHQVIDAYADVHANLIKHAEGFPEPQALHDLVTTGQPKFGMKAVGPDMMTPGAQAIVARADAEDERPLWISVWGGANTLAQALLYVRDTRGPDQLAEFVDKLRVYTISDQDDAGPWMRREFPDLHYIAMPSNPDGQQYREATWTGISGDVFYKNAPGADFGTWTDEWVDENIRSHGPLGANYPYPCCIHEGDTPSYHGLINNGLASYMSPTYGGWSGRYVWRRPSGEARAFWTQGGDSYTGQDSSRDTVTGKDGLVVTADHATIWRWREAFQHDFAARMDWSITDSFEAANHNPVALVNGVSGWAPIEISVGIGETVTLDAGESSDPDGNALTYRWWFYPEAGTGIPDHPVYSDGPRFINVDREGNEEIATRPENGLMDVVPRINVDGADTPTARVTGQVAGIAHVILEVTDDGSPALTSYRRMIVTVE